MSIPTGTNKVTDIFEAILESREESKAQGKSFEFFCLFVVERVENQLMKKFLSR